MHSKEEEEEEEEAAAEHSVLAVSRWAALAIALPLRKAVIAASVDRSAHAAAARMTVEVVLLLRRLLRLLLRLLLLLLLLLCSTPELSQALRLRKSYSLTSSTININKSQQGVRVPPSGTRTTVSVWSVWSGVEGQMQKGVARSRPEHTHER